MSENNVVSRYTTAARINHWITAVSLILLALSGHGAVPSRRCSSSPTCSAAAR